MNHIKTALINLNVEEVARYQPELLTPDTLIDLMAELQAWRETGERSCSAETPEYLQDYVEEMEEKAGQCNLHDHCNFDDYKEFFDDCVRTLEDERGRWPCAEPWDTGLKAVILDMITIGCKAENEESEGG